VNTNSVRANEAKTPVKKERTDDERRAAIRCWKELSKGLSLGGLKIRDLINEGRK
jgi:hypothetical protein